MEDLLEGLNGAQREAVTATEGYVRVVAGAGSGKTRALVRRFAYLVNEIGILPGNILCVTFTNKAANEMRVRIRQLTGDNDTGYINTFHGFCVSVLQEDSHAAGYPKSFLVLDNGDIDAMLKLIYEERGLTLRDMTFAKARDMIEMKKLCECPDYYLDLVDGTLAELEEKYRQAQKADEIIFYGYLYQEKKCFGLDYNDLLKFVLYIFGEKEEIRLKWQQRLEYIMIDEFQDIDDIQYRLMEVLAGFHKNLFVVGDPDQTIYTWRGARISFLLEFDQRFPGTKTIEMLQNYRSTPEILRGANALIAKNPTRIKKELVPMLPAGESVLCHMADSPEAEAEWMAERIAELHEKQEVPYGEIAVLYRAHYVTRVMEEVFLKQEIPYVIYSGVQFFQRREIKDALSYLRMIAWQDDLSFQRIANVPKRNLGEQRMRFLREYGEAHSCSLYQALRENPEEKLLKGSGAANFVKLIERWRESYGERSVSEVLGAVLDESGYEKLLRTEGSQERLDNLAELKQSIYAYENSCGEETTLESYLSHVALFTNSDAEVRQDRVRLMTVHTAKGLEFPYVFLSAMNEGIFPSRKTRTFAAMEEERRLAFVAVTRAEKRLFLSSADGLNFDGSVRYPSRFLLDMGSCLEYTAPPQQAHLDAAAAYAKKQEQLMGREEQEAEFSEGTRVQHRILGEGTILSIDADRKAYVIQFDGTDTPRSLAFSAKLKKT